MLSAVILSGQAIGLAGRPKLVLGAHAVMMRMQIEEGYNDEESATPNRDN